MPENETEAEEAALAAKIAAEHAAKAAEDADAAERELAQTTKSKASSRLCPHDNSEMVKHGPENPFKAGAWHCSACGCCFKGRELREGHSGCARAIAAEPA